MDTEPFIRYSDSVFSIVNAPTLTPQKRYENFCYIRGIGLHYHNLSYFNELFNYYPVLISFSWYQFQDYKDWYCELIDFTFNNYYSIDWDFQENNENLYNYAFRKADSININPKLSSKDSYSQQELTSLRLASNTILVFFKGLYDQYGANYFSATFGKMSSIVVSREGMQIDTQHINGSIEEIKKYASITIRS